MQCSFTLPWMAVDTEQVLQLQLHTLHKTVELSSCLLRVMT